MKKATFKKHNIVIDDSSNEELLFINDEPISYKKNDSGYTIYYHPPKPTLMEAAKSYLKSQPKI